MHLFRKIQNSIAYSFTYVGILILQTIREDATKHFGQAFMSTRRRC